MLPKASGLHSVLSKNQNLEHYSITILFDMVYQMTSGIFTHCLLIRAGLQLSA